MRGADNLTTFIIIFINCNWVVTRWQWLFYMYTNMKKKAARKFKSGGLHEKPIVLKSVSLNLLELSGPVQTCNGITLHLQSFF